ncbi:hypothetical protein GCM10020221_21050 [Streptomyces thioluteus]|uniref:Uncharacterized protein n=1 Tax=Streptomyces thioluteus TaxID=66431 RepID=A0ABP6JAN9_STRTU
MVLIHGWALYVDNVMYAARRACNPAAQSSALPGYASRGSTPHEVLAATVGGPTHYDSQDNIVVHEDTLLLVCSSVDLSAWSGGHHCVKSVPLHQSVYEVESRVCAVHCTDFRRAVTITPSRHSRVRHSWV